MYHYMYSPIKDVNIKKVQYMYVHVMMRDGSILDHKARIQEYTLPHTNYSLS